jgi:hypothetical protein
VKIRIIGGDRAIAFNGLVVVTVADGSEHDVAEALAAPLVRDGWAEPVERKKKKETKVVTPPETQAQPTLPDAITEPAAITEPVVTEPVVTEPPAAVE